MKARISVVVPVYNVEAYLKECVNSIIGQTYHNIEIILIDDGSTDNSGQLCDDFAEKDERIRVIHKENGGNTSARKVGIASATGEFLLFVDSDDWIDADMCESLLALADIHNADIVRSAYTMEFLQGRKRLVKDGIAEGVYQEERLEELYTNLIYCKDTWIRGINSGMYTQFVKRELLINTYEQVNDRIQYGEDLACNLLGILYAKVVCITHRAYYHYRIRNGSIIHSSNDRIFEQINLLYLFIRDIFEKHPFREVLLPQLNRLMDVFIVQGLNNMLLDTRSPRLPQNMFPISELPFGAKIILYGAGAIGQSYYMQLKADGVYNILAWVDKNYKAYQEEGKHVQTIDVIRQLEYDYIVLAVKEEDLAKRIREDLKNSFQVDDNRMIWREPIPIVGYYQRDN